MGWWEPEITRAGGVKVHLGLDRRLRASTVNLPLVGWASECPDVKNYKWRLNPDWHSMLYSCTHIMTTVVVKGLICFRYWLPIWTSIWNMWLTSRRWSRPGASPAAAGSLSWTATATVSRYMHMLSAEHLLSRDLLPWWRWQQSEQAYMVSIMRYCRR